MDSETAFATEVKCPSPPPLSSRLVNSAGTAEPERRRRRSRRRPSPRYENWSGPFTSGGLARGASRFGCSRSICFSACNNLSTLADASQGIGGSQQHQLTEPDYRLMNALFTAQQNFTVSGECLPTRGYRQNFTQVDVRVCCVYVCVCGGGGGGVDPSLPDNPIVYASDGFLKLTGYTREQVVARPLLRAQVLIIAPFFQWLRRFWDGIVDSFR